MREIIEKLEMYKQEKHKVWPSLVQEFRKLSRKSLIIIDHFITETTYSNKNN